MVEEYIKDFVTEAIAGNPAKKLTASALKFRIRNPQKRKRIDELLLMNEELKDAKKLDVDQQIYCYIYRTYNNKKIKKYSYTYNERKTFKTICCV